MAAERPAPTEEKARTKPSASVRRMRRTVPTKLVHISLRQSLIEVTEEVLAVRRKQALAAGKSTDDYTVPERLRRFTEDGFQAFLRASILEFLRLQRPVPWICATTRTSPEAIRALAVLEGIPIPDAGPADADAAALLHRIEDQDTEIAHLRLQVADLARKVGRLKQEAEGASTESPSAETDAQNHATT